MVGSIVNRTKLYAVKKDADTDVGLQVVPPFPHFASIAIAIEFICLVVQRLSRVTHQRVS